MSMQLVLVAADAALYPTLLAVVAILLAQPRRRLLLGAYLAGGLTMSIAIGLGIVVVLKGSGTVHDDRSGLSWIADVSVGALALMVAVVVATGTGARMKARHAHAGAGRPREPLPQRLLSGGSTPIVFLAALVINLPGAAYLIGLKDIAAGGHGAGGVIALVVAFNLIMFTLAEIPLAGLVLAPDRTVALVDEANGWFAANGREIVIVLSGGLGLFLIARGIAKA
jgi:hypothetical protein